MPTPHISAPPGAVAETVLMPGDPLRAKFIADTYLERPKEFNRVRGMLGYTGLFRGKPVSVMGSGMGMPSVGIYSYELYTQYGVEAIIRVGSAGAYAADIAVFDILLATAAFSESSFALTQNGSQECVTYPSEDLCLRLRESAVKLGKSMREGVLHSSDVFYRSPKPGVPYWQTLHDRHGCIAVEMESFALFHTASVTGKKAAALVTVSDSFIHPDITTPEEREKGFTEMLEIALGAV